MLKLLVKDIDIFTKMLVYFTFLSPRGAILHPLPPNRGQLLRCQYQSPYRPNGGAASPDTNLLQKDKKTKKGQKKAKRLKNKAKKQILQSVSISRPSAASPNTSILN